MSNFEFDENNHALIELPILAQNKAGANEDFSAYAEANRNKGLVQLAFIDQEFDWKYVQQITSQQQATLDYIKSNQEEIIASLFQYTKKVLYPVHIEFIGYDEISFPALQGVNDLRKALGVNRLTLFSEHKEQLAYYILSCDFSGDFEHGVQIIMHKSRVIGWEEDLVKDKVLEDIKQAN